MHYITLVGGQISLPMCSKQFSKKAADLNGQDKFGNTPLITALKNKNKVATEQLLKFKKCADGTVSERCVDVKMTLFLQELKLVYVVVEKVALGHWLVTCK